MKELGIFALMLGIGSSLVGCGADKPKVPATDAPKAGMDTMGEEKMKETPTTDHSKMKTDGKVEMKDDMPASDSAK
jgi:hypothetical protein